MNLVNELFKIAAARIVNEEFKKEAGSNSMLDSFKEMLEMKMLMQMMQNVNGDRHLQAQRARGSAAPPKKVVGLPGGHKNKLTWPGQSWLGNFYSRFGGWNPSLGKKPMPMRARQVMPPMDVNKARALAQAMRAQSGRHN